MNASRDSFLTSMLRLAESQGKGKKSKLRFSSFAGDKWILLISCRVWQKAVKWWKKGKKMAQKWAKHTQLGRVWRVGKFQDSSDGCKPVFSIPFSCHFSSLIFAVHRQYPVLKKHFHLLQNHLKHHKRLLKSFLC